MNATCSALKAVKLFIFILGGLGWMATSAFAQSGWQKSLKDLEKRHAQETVALNDRLISDLDALIKRAVRDGKLELANAMNERKGELESEVESLEKFSAPASARMGSVSRRVARELEEKVWSLENTTNVKAIAVQDAKVYAAMPDGRLTGSPQADTQALPRLFFGPRNDGGTSYYVFSPDMKRVLGLASQGHTKLTELPKKP